MAHRAGAWQLDTDTLDPVTQLWADSLHNGNGAVLIQVDLLDTAHVKVFLYTRGKIGLCSSVAQICQH